MPTISRFYGIVIAMYYNDHSPPHFHAIYGEYEATYEIASLAVESGFLPPRAQAHVLEWAHSRREEIALNWDRARAHLPLQEVAPLE